MKWVKIKSVLKLQDTAKTVNRNYCCQYLYVKRRNILKNKYFFGIPYMWNLKRNDTDELTKQKQTQTSRTNLWLRDERGQDEGKGSQVI